MRFFLHLAYDGTYYSGWQRQKNTPSTIQAIVEEKISEILKEKIAIVGCGRTDSGVHAVQFFAHFDYNSMLPDDFVSILNYHLPCDLAAYDVVKVPENSHARFAAKQREYTYFILAKPDPFMSRYATFSPHFPHDRAIVEWACKQILATKDFSNMCKQPDNNENSVCRIQYCTASWSSDNELFRIKIAADRFLRSMIRILIAKICDLERGKIEKSEFSGYLDGSIKRKHKDMAYPQGLHLTKVTYPFLDHSVFSPHISPFYYRFISQFE